MKKNVSAARLWAIKLKRERPSVYYSRKRAAERKYRKGEKYREYHRKYMVKWRKKLSTGRGLA